MTEALAALRERLREPTAAAWQNTELRRWIMEAARDIARRTKCFEKSGTVAVIANTRTYTAPVDMLIDGIQAAYFTPTGSSQEYPVEYREIASLGHVWLMNGAIDKSYKPDIFTIWGVVPTASILLYPIPNVNGTFTIYYYRLPADPFATNYSSAASDGTTIDIPEGWIDLVYDGAEYRAWRRDRKDNWQEAKQLFEESLNTLANSAGSHSQQPQFITPYRMPTPYWQQPGYPVGGY